MRRLSDTRRSRLVPTERIAEFVWGEQRPDDVSAPIQTFVSVLRRHLASERDRARQLVVTEAGAYRFATHQVDLDLDRFDELLERSAGEPTRSARRSLATALALVRGVVLEDEPYAGWAQDLRGSYQGRVLGAHLDAADHALAERDFADALAHSDAAATLDRFSERAQRTGMLALYALGRQHDALARYRCYRAALDQELRLEPTAETRALEVSILRQDDALSLLPRPIKRAELPNPRFVAKALANGHPRAASTTLTEALVAQCRAEGIHDQAHMQDEGGHVPADGDLAARARGRRAQAHPRARPGSERAPTASCRLSRSPARRTQVSHSPR